MKIARVFPHKESSFTPIDKDCYFSPPPVFRIPKYDEIHVSCVFTWDKPKAEYLAAQWAKVAPVRIGGPAYGSPCEDFIPSRYVAPGIIFTTRGCPNNCVWGDGRKCFVPRIEGTFKELPIVPGRVIQDNNVLACSEGHWNKLITMLKKQSMIQFKGGLEPDRLTEKRIQDLRGLKISELWLACDIFAQITETTKAIKRLHAAGFTEKHIYVYALCGKDEEEEQARMEQLFIAGGYPFGQLYQPEERIEYSKEWLNFQRSWSRPAIIYSKMKSLLGKL